jgi:NTE family protein
MKWALVLSGGGALGLAHLGVIKVLDREGFYPDLIAGTSMGAVIGALWANGSSIKEMETIARDFNIQDFQEGITFKETKIPFYCNAVDLLQGNEIVIHDGSLSDGVYASMAYPGFFSPLERPDSLLCDGSVINNYPVWIARQFGRTKVLGVDVSAYENVSPNELNNGLAILFRAYLTACQTQKRRFGDRANLTLHIKSDRTGFDFVDIEGCINRGEEAALKGLKEIKRTLKYPLPGRRILKV